MNMEITDFLAQLIGWYSVVMGLSMSAKRRMLMSVFKEIFHARALSYVMGVIMLILGLLLVLLHSVWTGLVAIIISILGWFAIIESIGFLFFSKDTLKIALKALNNKEIYFTISIIYILLGVCLLYFVYSF